MTHPAAIPNSRLTGFTLLELSIVLVIIGLLIGAILVGRDLIEAAKIRKQISDLDKFSSAEHAFELKFNAVPGDIIESQAVAVGLSYCTESYTGNGQIDDANGAMPIVYTWCEPLNFWQNLTEAGLIKDYVIATFDSWEVGVSFPKLALNDSAGITVSSWKGFIWYYLGISTGNTTGDALISDLSTQGVITPPQAYAMDKKIDDGVPSTGTVLAIVPDPINSSLDGTLDTTAAQCVLDGTAKAYNVQNDNYWCRLYVRL